ncbi:MAG: nucleoside triphosphate pyrophosphohydrolase [Ruminococcaceae bacterium]|nr:nucleoside triphosphate pyrophosphohydrolase [Oscillospiraceae bacterium]
MTIQQEILELKQKERYDFKDLQAITRILRSEEGCPWDREQDHHSIRASMIEETYEVVEAIDTENPVLLREELGDAMFQVMFHAQIEDECGRFDVGDVVDDICKKMIHRHPHVFGTVQADTSDAVLQNWEMIKTEEKQRNTLSDKLHAIPPMLPALMRASKVSKKAGRTEDQTAQSLIDSLIAGLTSLGASSQENAQAQIGTLLFEMVDLSRVLDVDAELALSAKTDAFIDEIANR